MTGQKARGSIFTVIFSRVRENLSRPYQKNRESESVRALRERSLRLRMKRRAGTGLSRDRAWAFPGSPCCTTCANDTHVQLNYRSASASSHLPVGRSSAHCHTGLPRTPLAIIHIHGKPPASRTLSFGGVLPEFSSNERSPSTRTCQLSRDRAAALYVIVKW